MPYWYAGAMVLSALIGANSGGMTQENENAAPLPGGGGGAPGTGPMNQPPTADPLQQSLAEILQGGNLPDVLAQGQQAAQSTAAAAGNTQTADPGLKAPQGADPPAGDKDITPPENGDIGNVLAAIPAALAAMDGLFNQPPNQRTERAAPVAGGSPGGVVGQFGRPMGQNVDIGRLLASLPGIR